MTSERRSSCATEPVIAIFAIADISSMLRPLLVLPVLSALPRLSSSEYFRSETTFLASDHRGILAVANDYFLPLSTFSSSPLFFFFFFFEFIAIHLRQRTIFAFPLEIKKDVFFTFYLFSNIILFWRWFCFFITCRWCLRQLSSFFHIHIPRTTTGMFLFRVFTDRFALYRHNLYLLLRTELLRSEIFLSTATS